MLKRPTHSHGFSLVEVSIVMVIIGLVLGGVIVGKEMITTAQLRASVSQIESYKTATITFKNKYACLPGDCASAVSIGLGSSGGAGDNGNGNSRVEGYVVALLDEREAYNFWYHLSQAKLISGSYPGYTGPIAPVTGVDFPSLQVRRSNVIAIGTDQNLIWVTGEMTGPPGSNSVYGILSPAESFFIDSKIDDGYPVSGIAILTAPQMDDGPYISQSQFAIGTPAGTGATHGSGGPTSNVCVNTDTSPNTYNTTNISRHNSTLCMLVMKAGF
jgi:prepilin-type N-terminal cleavage/methylation domain-containing protein